MLIQENIYRPNEFTFYEEPLKIILMQYLSLFPTIGELLQKPYKLLITLDSILIIYQFYKIMAKNYLILFILIRD